MFGKLKVHVILVISFNVNRIKVWPSALCLKIEMHSCFYHIIQLVSNLAPDLSITSITLLIYVCIGSVLVSLCQMCSPLNSMLFDLNAMATVGKGATQVDILGNQVRVRLMVTLCVKRSFEISFKTVSVNDF